MLYSIGGKGSDRKETKKTTPLGNEYETLSDTEIVIKNIHIGVEMGGSSCKVGIFHNSDGAKTELKKLYLQVFITSETNAMETFTQMKDWITEKLSAHCLQASEGKKIYPGSMGLASFGPCCLDKTS